MQTIDEVLQDTATKHAGDMCLRLAREKAEQADLMSFVGYVYVAHDFYLLGEHPEGIKVCRELLGDLGITPEYLARNARIRPFKYADEFLDIVKKEISEKKDYRLKLVTKN